MEPSSLGPTEAARGRHRTSPNSPGIRPWAPAGSGQPAPLRPAPSAVGQHAESSRELVRVVIADDEPRFRRVIDALLIGEAGIEVVGQACDGEVAISLARALAPDVVLLDVRMPNMGGLAAAREIHRLLPTTKIVMLTSSDDEEDVHQAIAAGASGYLLKQDLMYDVAAAVRTVAQGLGLLLAPPIASKLLGDLAEGPTVDAGPLSERELEVLRLMGEGHPNHRIAAELCLSPHTVKRHVANILAKLNQRSRVEAVLHAVRLGMLTADAS